VRGRRERELEQHWSLEDRLGATIRAWRHFHGLTVTELAIRAGFGKNGRGYISKIEHDQIKRLGEEPLAAIAQALDLPQIDLQRHRMPEVRESQNPDKETLDDAIAGCKAWLKVYRQDDNLLDCARTYFEIAELCWERMKLTERREERGMFLADALQSIDQALPLFREGAPGSYEEAQRLRSTIEREIHLKNLDDAIAGCKALLKISRQEERPLDWARTHARLAQLYRDRATQSEQADERCRWLGKALQSIDQALPLFREHAPISYTQAQRMRLDVETAREEILRSS
jgi:transcriptional regulator with XRE-family HTH domain